MLSYRMGAAYITLKKGNMRKEQCFVLYPYTSGEMLILQSDKRIMELNLANGWIRMNGRNEQNGAKFYHLVMGSIKDQLTDAELQAIREHLRRSSGTQGNSILKWENAIYK
jgi:hypothetical protein